ncbi:MAG: hypothetical protein H0U10_12595 [Chloroflexia bacterium]|nr:hypothetical protein [Chloroflexia bacterium]
MPRVREREYVFALEEPDDRLRVQIATETGEVVAFLVQYETYLEGSFVPVSRYDSAHGVPHQDTLDRSNRVIRRRWLHGLDLKDALRLGDRDLRANWPDYKAEFFGVTP